MLKILNNNLFYCSDLSVPLDENGASDDSSLTKKQMVKKKWNQIKKVNCRQLIWSHDSFSNNLKIVIVVDC